MCVVVKVGRERGSAGGEGTRAGCSCRLLLSDAVLTRSCLPSPRLAAAVVAIAVACVASSYHLPSRTAEHAQFHRHRIAHQYLINRVSLPLAVRQRCDVRRDGTFSVDPAPLSPITPFAFLEPPPPPPPTPSCSPQTRPRHVPNSSPHRLIDDFHSSSLATRFPCLRSLSLPPAFAPIHARHGVRVRLSGLCTFAHARASIPGGRLLT